MRPTRRGDNAMAFLLLALTLGYFALGWTYDPLTRALPELVSGITAGLLIVYLLVTNLGKAGLAGVGRQQMAWRQDEAGQGAETKGVPVPVVLTALALPIAYLLLFLFLGIIPAVFLFVSTYLWKFGKARWYVALTAGALSSFAVYALFLTLLKYPLYTGIFRSP